MNEALVGSVSGLIETFLHQGAVIDVDGIGTLALDVNGALYFNRNEAPRIFLSYAMEDRSLVKRLYDALHSAGFEPWMDVENLLPGQNWPRAIENAIEMADYFVGCFSSRSVSKRGHFQSELSFAWDVAARVPADHAYFLPLRFDDCDLPEQIKRRVHYVDLWPDWERGISVLTRALRLHEKGKRRVRS